MAASSKHLLRVEITGAPHGATFALNGADDTSTLPPDGVIWLAPGPATLDPASRRPGESRRSRAHRGSSRPDAPDPRRSTCRRSTRPRRRRRPSRRRRRAYRRAPAPVDLARRGARAPRARAALAPAAHRGDRRRERRGRRGRRRWRARRAGPVQARRHQGHGEGHVGVRHEGRQLGNAARRRHRLRRRGRRRDRRRRGALRVRPPRARVVERRRLDGVVRAACGVRRPLLPRGLSR